MGGSFKKEGNFGLYKPKDKKFWYYWVYDAYLGRHRFSTGCRRKADAQNEVFRRKQAGELIPVVPLARQNITVSEFGTGFWNYDTCPIIRGKVQRGGHYSPKVAIDYNSKFMTYIKPQFGGCHLKDLTSNMIEEWLLNMPEEYSITNKTANDAFFVFRQMLEYAVFSSLIDRNPAKSIKPLVKQSIRKGAFTPEQVRLLFSKPWENEWAYAACFLASRTGMRIGEVRALTTGQIHPDYIEVNASWSNEEGRKSTKSGFSRFVPITEEMYKMLMNFAPVDSDGLLFSLDGEKPVKDDYFSRRLKARMDEINAEKKEKIFDYGNKQAPLSFHSFRHFLNTRLLAADMPTTKIQAIIGHESDKMTEHYAHLDANDLASFRRLQLELA